MGWKTFRGATAKARPQSENHSIKCSSEASTTSRIQPANKFPIPEKSKVKDQLPEQRTPLPHPSHSMFFAGSGARGWGLKVPILSRPAISGYVRPLLVHNARFLP